jgi:predicted CXXCH cytochrome family protein
MQKLHFPLRRRWLIVGICLALDLVPQSNPVSAGTEKPTCVTSTCHSNLVQGVSVHGPVKARGGCLVCHEESSAKRGLPAGHLGYAPITATEMNGKCIVCHDSMAHLVRKGSAAHGAIAKQGCVGCHDSHHSQAKWLLKENSTTVHCSSCHAEKIEVKSETLAGRHAVVGRESCLSCHDAHLGGGKRPLKAPSDALCLSCHKDELKAAGGRVLPTLKAWTDPKAAPHGAAKKLQCVDCHSMHSSRERSLLKGAYTEGFYTGDEDGPAALCFKCHKPELAEQARTSSATAFRNGNRNLHSLHLHQKGKSRSCRACHEVHQTHQDYLLAEWVPFSGMKLPLKFEKRSDGGSCATACHGRFAYGRSQEVSNRHGK